MKTYKNCDFFGQRTFCTRSFSSSLNSFSEKTGDRPIMCVDEQSEADCCTSNSSLSTDLKDRSFSIQEGKRLISVK